MTGKTLIERSPTAKKAGGPQEIRKLPKLQRQLLSAKVAMEIGKPRAARACAEKAIVFELTDHLYSPEAETIANEYDITMKDAAKKAVAELMKRKEYSHALGIANRFDLEKEIKEAAARKKAEKDLKGEHYSSAVRTAQYYGLDLTKEVLKEIEGYLESERYTHAVVAARAFGLDFGPCSPIVRKAIERYMELGWYSDAAYTAKEYGFEELMKEAAKNLVKEYLRSDKFSNAAEISKEYGLTENEIKEVVDGLISFDAFGMVNIYEEEIKDAFGIKKEVTKELIKKHAKKQVEEDMKKGNHLSAACLSKEYGFENLMKKAAKKAIKYWTEMAKSEENKYKKIHCYSNALDIAKEFGLELKKAARKVVDEKMPHPFSFTPLIELLEAERIAKKHGIEKEYDFEDLMKKAARKVLDEKMRASRMYLMSLEKILEAEKIAKEHGIENEYDFEELIKEVARREVAELIEQKRYGSAEKIAKEHDIEDDFEKLMKENMRKIVDEKIRDAPSMEDISEAERIAKKHGVEKEYDFEDLMKKAARREVAELIEQKRYADAQELAEEYNFRKEIKIIKKQREEISEHLKSCNVSIYRDGKQIWSSSPQ